MAPGDGLAARGAPGRRWTGIACDFDGVAGQRIGGR